MCSFNVVPRSKLHAAILQSFYVEMEKTNQKMFCTLEYSAIRIVVHHFFLEDYPMKAMALWEGDLGPISGSMGGGPSIR